MISIYPVHPSSHRVSRWTKRPSTGRQKTTNVYLDDLVRWCSQTWQPGCALGCLRTFFWCSHDAQVGLLGLIIFSFSSQTIFKENLATKLTHLDLKFDNFAGKTYCQPSRSVENSKNNEIWCYFLKSEWRSLQQNSSISAASGTDVSLCHSYFRGSS